MNTYRKPAIFAGIFFITAQVSGILSAVILGPILDAPDYLVTISTNGTQMMLGAFCGFIMAVSAAGIAVSLYPILKKHSEGLALWASGFRLIECALFFVGVTVHLSLLTVSQAFVQAGAPDAPSFHALGQMLLDGLPWLLGGLAFCLGALLYYYAFYQLKLVPRWLSGLGLIAVVLALVSYLLQFFRIETNLAFVLHMPTLVQELIFAVWLIVKGVNTSALDTASASTY